MGHFPSGLGLVASFELPSRNSVRCNSLRSDVCGLYLMARAQICVRGGIASPCQVPVPGRQVCTGGRSIRAAGSLQVIVAFHGENCQKFI